MPEANDMELLREYAQSGSESAFAELVQRHINLVYSVAQRHVGITAHAEEITQAVFIILARKASSLRPNTILEGWLHTTTRLTALSFLRGERRRQFREQEAYMQSTPYEADDTSHDATWERLAPLLDDAISRLGQKDRDALVLRFFKDKSIREVASALTMNEAAAQRRVLRALEKLRKIFVKRGVSLTSAIIVGAISTNSVQAAPVALAKSVSAVALANGAVASGSTLTLIKGALKIMAWTKAKTAVMVGATVIMVAGTTTVMVRHHRQNQPLATVQTTSDPAEFPKASWRFAGYADPESTFQSWMWAAGRGDVKSFLAGFSPNVQAGLAGKSDSQIISAKDKSDFEKMTGYHILDKQVLSDDEVVLSILVEGLNQTKYFPFNV